MPKLTQGGEKPSIKMLSRLDSTSKCVITFGMQTGSGLSYQMSEFSGPNSWDGMALILKALLLILIR